MLAGQARHEPAEEAWQHPALSAGADVFAQRRTPSRDGRARRSGGSSSPTAARSRSGSSAPAMSWAWRRSPSTAMRTPTPRTSGWPMSRSGSGRRRRPRATCAIDAIIEAARATGAEAVHPGYGFLAERAAFARAVEDAGLVFVGPSPDAIDALGDKLHARRTRACGRRRRSCPERSSRRRSTGADEVDAIVAEAEAIGFPLLVKAAAGGGGRGMRRVDAAATCRPRSRPAPPRRRLRSATARSTSSARSCRPATSRSSCSATRPGEVVAIGERDCSIQRRHQKLVEEARRRA